MIIDDIQQLGNYSCLNPRFKRVAQFLATTDLTTLPVGHHEIEGEDIFVNIMDCAPKGREDARLETHNRMIDIQIPISAPEEHGWIPRCQLPEAPYDEQADISFYDGLAQNYFMVQPGQFTIYFPQDGHAPAITPVPVRKAIFKIKA